MPTRSPAQELDLQEVLLCTLPTPAPVDTDRVLPRHRLRSSLMLSDCQSSWIQQMPLDATDKYALHLNVPAVAPGAVSLS